MLELVGRLQRGRLASGSKKTFGQGQQIAVVMLLRCSASIGFRHQLQTFLKARFACFLRRLLDGRADAGLFADADGGVCGR